MKKTTIIILFASFMTGVINAQDAPFQIGTNVISAGVGFGSAIGSGSYSSQTPVIQVHYEHGQWAVGGPGVISIGGYLGFLSHKYEYDYFVPPSFNYSVTDKWSYTIIGVRSAYHYNALKNDKFDVYGGLMLSYDINHYSYESTDPYYQYSGGANNNTISLTGFVGGRYFFSTNWAGYAELGYGVSFLNLGASYKF
jgi:hypothetical protein